MAPHDLAKHVLLPVPSLKDHKSPDGREETLRTIIKNIETQQQQVRYTPSLRIFLLEEFPC